jgi:peroxiredoxin
MSKRLAVLLAPFCCLALPFSPPPFATADTAASGIGKPVPGFTLKDTRGQSISLKDFKDKKAVVVVFIGTECPLSNAVLPSLAQLHKEYAPKGIQFLGINSNRHDTPEQIAAHAEKYGIPFAVLKDADNHVADQFGARRTPEVFLLDAEGKLRYQGRVDDQFGVGYKRAKPTRRDLAEALNEVLAGKPVTQATTPVAGCVIARATKPKADGAVTYTKQVARIMQQRCQECHRPGQVGPMSLRTYDSAVAWSETIREVISDRRMPPWHVDPRYGKFSNDRSLSAQERDTLLAWIDQGCPKGDDKDLPPPREFTADWKIGQPDLILTMQKEFDVPAVMPRGGVPYKYFTVPTNFTEDRWVVRAEAKAGAPGVVHHIVVFMVPPGQKFNPDDPESQVLCGTAPGDMPLILPPGMAKKVPAGARLIYQMHYTPNGKPQKDRSSVGLIFAKKPPEGEVHTVPVFNASFLIKPGDSNYLVESEFTFARDAKVVSFMPHMHLRGKDFLIEAIYPDKKKEILLSVPRFDFNWQSAYRFSEPRVMPKGTMIHCVAHFDNSAKNLNNPDPTAVVYWGDQTWEEMMIGWMDFAYDRKPK